MLFARGQIGAAVPAAREAVRLSRNADPESQYMLASLYFDLGHPAEAEPLLTSALAGRPDWSQVNLWLGLVKFQLGKIDEAALLLQKAATKDP